MRKWELMEMLGSLSEWRKTHIMEKVEIEWNKE